jgi:hypothetical protein
MGYLSGDEVRGGHTGFHYLNHIKHDISNKFRDHHMSPCDDVHVKTFEKADINT